MGCTHFPLYEKHIAAFMGSSVRLVDPGKVDICKMQKQKHKETKAAHEFYVSGDPEAFKIIAGNLLGMDIRPVKIDIEKY